MSTFVEASSIWTIRCYFWKYLLNNLSITTVSAVTSYKDDMLSFFLKYLLHFEAGLANCSHDLPHACSSKLKVVFTSFTNTMLLARQRVCLRVSCFFHGSKTYISLQIIRNTFDATWLRCLNWQNVINMCLQVCRNIVWYRIKQYQLWFCNFVIFVLIRKMRGCLEKMEFWASPGTSSIRRKTTIRDTH